MPPSTHNSRRSGITLSQFAAPVSPALLPPVFENSRFVHLPALITHRSIDRFIAYF